MTSDSIVTIGSQGSCNLQLDDPSVSAVHAQGRLDPGHFLWIRDDNSARGVFLKRNDAWVRAKLIAVCTGDLLRFGDVEVELDRITRLFGPNADVRLAPTPAASLFDARTGRYTLRNRDDEPTLTNPRRDPGTGKVEGDSS